MENKLSYSRLKALLKSPKALTEYLAKKQEPTPAMQFGTAVHAYILEPQVFAAHYIVAPEIDRRTKAGKEAWQALQDTGKTILSASDFEDIKLYAANVAALPTAKDYLANALAFEELIECKLQTKNFGEFDFAARLDVRGTDYIIDLKTCQDASPQGFRRAMYKEKYHLQAALYSLLFPKHEFMFLAVDTHAAMLYRVGKETMQDGLQLLHFALNRFKDCQALGWDYAYNVDGDIYEI